MQVAWQQLVGRTLEGRYRLVHFIDAGSFGGVYDADEVVGDTVMRSIALKLLRPPLANRDGQPPTPEQRDALVDLQLHELQLASRLEHPHLIRSYSVGMTELPAPAPPGLAGELLYIVMELGEATLADRIRERILLAPEALELAQQLCGVLRYLHDEADPAGPLAHRDLKPANILRVPSPRGGFRWKLTDLGALLACGGRGAASVERIGTLEYAAPEALTSGGGAPADMWALGVALCEALTGELPFGDPAQPSDTPALQRAILHDAPRLPERLPAPLDSFILRCLERDPARRLAANEGLTLLAGGLQARAVTPPSIPQQALPTAPLPASGPAAPVATLAHDTHAEAQLRLAVQRALDDRVLSPYERSELNELRKRLDIRLERAAAIFREEHARVSSPAADEPAPAHAPAPSAPLLAPPLMPGLPPPDPQAFQRTVAPGALQPPTASPPLGTAPQQYIVDADTSRPADFRSIAAAVAAVPGGSRIQIRTGLYKEHLVLDKPLELAGYDSRGQVLIQSPDRHGIIVNCDGAALKRLHVKAGTAGSGATSDVPVSALVVSQGRLEAEDCVFECASENCVAVFGPTALALLRRCEISGGRSVGLSATHDARAVAEHCQIHGNGLAGASCSTGGTLRLLRTRISQCRGYGVLVYVEGTASLRECEVSGNANDGVALKNGGQAEIERCTITGNAGAAVLVQPGCHAAVRGCNLAGNRGRAINAQRGATVVREANVE